MEDIVKVSVEHDELRDMDNLGKSYFPSGEKI